jgi:hypothetical protein
LTEERGFICEGTDDVTLDVSDLTWDSARKVFWILGDDGACVFLFAGLGGFACSSELYEGWRPFHDPRR